MTQGTRGGELISSGKGGRWQTAYRKRWALVIGIDDYGGAHRPLRNAGNDAREFANLLRFYRFDSHELFNEQATKPAILGYLRDSLPSQMDVQEDDCLVIFFAGHGMSQDGKRGYIVPYGAGQAYADYISMGELREVCDTLKARHILIILDCCFSGMAASRSGHEGVPPPGDHDEALLRELLSKPAWQIVMAGDADEPVADSGRNPDHSAFTYHLLQGLSGGADAQGDRIVTARELEQYLYNNVYEDTKGTAQPRIPLMNYINTGVQRGDFVFRIPDDIPHPWVEDVELPPPPPPPPLLERARSAVLERVKGTPPLYLALAVVAVLLVALAATAVIGGLRPDPAVTPTVAAVAGNGGGTPTGGTLMTGDFNVAVADFAVGGEPALASIGPQAAERAFVAMQEELDTLQDIAIDVWGPERTSRVEGFTRAQRTRAAEQIAADIGADVIVYAFLDFTTTPAEMTVEFAMPDKTLTDAAEIAGEHQFGQPVALSGNGNLATRNDVVAKLETRVDLLATIIVGLSYYKANDYEQALTFFQRLEPAGEWEAVGGKEVLYLLLGNTHGKLRNLDAAETAFEQALVIDPGYARAYAGLGSVLYLRALAPAQAAQDITQADPALLDRAAENHESASEAPDQPVLADIPTKVEFGLGQVSLTRALATGSDDFSTAITKFEAVVVAYGDGANPRVRELAAEAHARLGLIYVERGDKEAAIAEYEKAVELSDDLERRENYQTWLRELRGQTDT